MRRPRLPGSFTLQAERAALLAWEAASGKVCTRARVESRFNVSRATAKRDLALLRRVLGDQLSNAQGGSPETADQGAAAASGTNHQSHSL